MAEIFKFPETTRTHNAQVIANQAERKRLAEWFRAIAQHIEGNEIERPPLAAMIVLSGTTGDEVLHIGYQQEGVSLPQAGTAAQRMATAPYPRRGGNFFDRRR